MEEEEGDDDAIEMDDECWMRAGDGTRGDGDLAGEGGFTGTPTNGRSRSSSSLITA